MLHLDKKNCRFLKKMMNHAKNSEHQKTITEFVNYILITYLQKIYHHSIINENESAKRNKKDDEEPLEMINSLFLDALEEDKRQEMKVLL